MRKPTRIVANAEYEIPEQFCREIGRIIVRWAYLENIVRRLAWDILGVDQKLGRVAIRDPRLDGYLEMILEIAYLKNITIDRKKLSSLFTRINEVGTWRDLLCHGIWIPGPNGWLIQKISGKYPKDYDAEHPKRRINPEGINIDAEGLQTVSNGLEMLIEETAMLRSGLKQPPSSSLDTQPAR